MQRLDVLQEGSLPLDPVLPLIFPPAGFQNLQSDLDSSAMLPSDGSGADLCTSCCQSASCRSHSSCSLLASDSGLCPVSGLQKTHAPLAQDNESLPAALLATTKRGCRAYEPTHLGSGSLCTELGPAEELLLPTESPSCSQAH